MGQLMEKQRTARSLGTLECTCPDSTCLDSSSCVHTAAPKPEVVTPAGGRGRRLLHHRHLHESSNQVGQRANARSESRGTSSNSSQLFLAPKFFETDARWGTVDVTASSQVSSTTMLGGPELPSPPAS